jgi:hypothetical protein
MRNKNEPIRFKEIEMTYDDNNSGT